MMIQIFICVFLVITYFFLWAKWRYSYWTRKGAPQLPPQFPFGNLKQVFMGEKQMSLDIAVKEFYEEFKRKGYRYGGVYIMMSPTFIPVDIKLIGNILQRDFQHFTDHAIPYHHEKDVLSEHVFSLEGEKWKNIRSSLTPVFTSGKMKFMFDIVNQMGEILETKIINKTNAPLDIKEAIACYATDVIATCAFGLDTKCMENPNAEFRQYGKAILQQRTLKQLLEFLLPWDLLGNLGHKFLSKDVREYFIGVMQETLTNRKKHSIYRKDFVQLLLELRDKDEKQSAFSLNNMLASMFIFYLAGFDTSSTTTAFVMYELAKNQKIQDKLREEVRTVLKKYNGKLTYEALQEMKYVHQCFEESLRMYPVGAILTRKVTQTYEVPDSDLVLEKGTQVLIPVMGIQRDPDYYENPNVFNPERFSEEEKSQRTHYTFIPFGDGPRQCIGLRFAYMQSKIALAYLVKDHKYTLNKQTPTEVTFAANTPVLSTNEKLILDVTRVNTE